MKTFLRLYRDACYDVDSEGRQTITYTYPKEAEILQMEKDKAYRKGLLQGIIIGAGVVLITVIIGLISF
jgi:hypothetical protein